MKTAAPSTLNLPAPMPQLFLRRWLTRGRFAAFLVSLITLVPLLVVLSSILYPQSDIWEHLVQYVLPEILSNTFWLVLGVAVGTGLLGIALAWLTAVCEFPGSRFFSWALMLPLAMPAYVTAFVAIGLLDFTGPVQTLLREWFGSSAWFPSIRSRGGVILVMTLALYPYVYLLARNAFLTQGKRALEAGQSLGLSRHHGFIKIALPMARPWIAAGIMLVLMETLADFGTVAIFNYDTFTTAIYKAWFGLFSLSTASQLASLLVLIVFLLVAAEQRLRGVRRYHVSSGKAVASKYRLKPALGWLAALFSGTVFCAAFAIPVVQLVHWTISVFAEDFDSRYPMFVWHSLLLSAMAAVLVVMAALVLSYVLRLYHDWPTRFFVRLSTLGYAIPGTVLAVGIFIPVAWLDNQLLAWLKPWVSTNGSIFKGTLLVMLLAFVARFLAPGFNAVDSAMQRITRSQEEAARGMGLNGWRLLVHVHIPLLRGGLLTAALMVFVDVMKEMPITLMTRPFGWDTLSVRIFEMTSEGQWDRAALPAVALVIAGLLPVILLTRQSEQ